VASYRWGVLLAIRYARIGPRKPMVFAFGQHGT
jgi:hypothetical protein